MPDQPTTPRRLTRRDFMLTSACAAAAGLGAVAGCARSRRQSAQVPVAPPPPPAQPAPAIPKPPEMRTLGRTGLKLGALSMGGAGIEVDVYKAGLGRGLNFIHSSLSYGTLDRVGRAVEDERDRVLLGLKFGRMDAEYLDASLAQLKVDYVDVLFFPLNSPEEARNRAHLQLFEQLRKRGKARFLGITTHSLIPATLQAAVEAGFWDVLMLSYIPDPQARAALRPVLDRAHEKNLGVVAMKTMAGIQPTTLAHMQTVLKQVLADPTVTTLVKGALSYESLDALLHAVAAPLTSDEAASLRTHLASRRGETCFLCGSCPPCPRGVNVFEVMRAFDYYYAQAGLPDLARAMYRQIPPAQRGGACDDCGLCTSKCPYRMAIARHVRAAHLVLG